MSRPYRLKELFNVNYLIVSQTNPHAIPFIQTEQRPTLRLHKRCQSPGLLSRLVAAASYLLCSEVKLRCHQLVDLGLAPGFLSLLLNQRYVGDVTIVPPLTLEGYMQIISNPSIDSFQRFVMVAERRTWPNLEHIRSQCQVEMVLDDCVRYLAHRAQSQMMTAFAWRPSRAADPCRDDESATADVSLDRSGKQEGDLSRASPLIGRPRHTHLDLCQFFSSPESKPATSRGCEEDDEAMLARRCDVSVHNASNCIDSAGGGSSCRGVEVSCGFDAGGVGVDGFPNLATDRGAILPRKPRSAPRLQWLQCSSSGAGLDFCSPRGGEMRRDADVATFASGTTRRGLWELVGPEEARGLGRREEASGPGLIVKSKSFPFTLAASKGAELECN